MRDDGGQMTEVWGKRAEAFEVGSGNAEGGSGNAEGGRKIVTGYWLMVISEGQN